MTKFLYKKISPRLAKATKEKKKEKKARKRSLSTAQINPFSTSGLTSQLRKRSDATDETRTWKPEDPGLNERIHPRSSALWCVLD